MKTKIVLAAGIGVGTVLYDAIRYGFTEVDWYRGAFVAVFAAVLLLPRRWFEKMGSQ